MRHFIVNSALICLLWSGSLSMLAAVDLFGAAANGKVSKAEQERQYLDLFADEDKQANTSKRRWALALKLEKLLANDDLSEIHTYMARRIRELLKRERSLDAYRLNLKAFDLIYPGPSYQAKQAAELRKLLELLWKKESGRKRNAVGERMVALMRDELIGALDVNDIDTAQDISEELGDWYKDLLDRKGQSEMEMVEKALSEREKFSKKLKRLQSKADQGHAPISAKPCFPCFRIE